MRRPGAFALAVALGIGLDQGSKAAIFHWLSGPGKPETYPIVSGALHVTPVRNPGVAFGVDVFPSAVVLIASIATVVLLCWLYAKGRASAPAAQLWAFALLIAGAAGNAVDRAAIGKVLDFIDVRIWPVFNVADIYICVGVGLYLLSECLLAREDRGEGGPPAEARPAPQGAPGEPGAGSPGGKGGRA